MTPRFEISNEKKLVGKRLKMSFADYKAGELWKDFLSKRNEICNCANNELISISVYKSKHFEDFKSTDEFDKWAAVEVMDFENVPNEMETFVLPSGLCAVFDYKGLNTDNSIFKYILGMWLPSSQFTLDDRPHFEVLGDKYKNNDPTSEEEIWIPIKKK